MVAAWLLLFFIVLFSFSCGRQNVVVDALYGEQNVLLMDTCN